MNPKWFQMVSPIPIPGVSKIPPGGRTIRKKQMFGDSLWFLQKNQKSTLPGGFKRGPHEKYSRRFLEGVQKEEIQQWRQARSLPGEKETLNIMLREKRIENESNLNGIMDKKLCKIWKYVSYVNYVNMWII